MNDANSILKIPGNTGYWLVRADGGKYYEDFFLNNFIAISDNEITLEKISESAKGSIAGIAIEHYKTLYKEVYGGWTSQQISLAASRTQKFMDEMKIGDLILVPSKKSTDFLVGIITSDTFEITEKEITSKVEVNYPINQFFKRREVQWLKEVSRKDISEKLYWILSAHQTIFDLSGQKDYINQLLAPVYIQDGLCHGTLKISKKEGLNSDEWFELYSIIKAKSDKSQDEVIVKSNVQSPGLIEFVAENAVTIIAVTTALSGVLWGDINVAGVKVKGILPYFQTHKKGNIEIEKSKKELDMMEEDQKAKHLENERTQLELDMQREEFELKKIENEAERLRLQLQISSFDAGTVFVNQTQTDSGDDLDAAES